MEIVIGCLFGIFIGIATAGYMFIQPLADRDKTIQEQKEENLQIYDENREVRQEMEELRFDLSVVNRKLEQKDEIVEKMKTALNDFMTKENKLIEINELVNDYQSIN